METNQIYKCFSKHCQILKNENCLQVNNQYFKKLKVSSKQLLQNVYSIISFLNVYPKIELLCKEIDDKEKEDYTYIDIDSDMEIEEESDDEAYSADEAPQRKVISYDIEKMFEIIERRDYHGWAIDTLKNRYRQLSENKSTAKYQIHR